MFGSRLVELDAAWPGAAWVSSCAGDGELFGLLVPDLCGVFGSGSVLFRAGFVAFRKSSRSCFLCCWLRCSLPLVAGRPWWWRCCVSQRWRRLVSLCACLDAARHAMCLRVLVDRSQVRLPLVVGGWPSCWSMLGGAACLMVTCGLLSVVCFMRGGHEGAFISRYLIV